jgi:diaminopimelate decarboxylase
VVTLANLIPSLRGLVQSRLEPGIWPRSTQTTSTGDLLVSGVSLTELAARFGTPTYVLDQAEVRRRCKAYHAALPEAEIAFAAKALPCRAVLRWIAEENMSLDVCSAGELAVARSVDFPAQRILMHGNVKTPEDLKAALAYGVGRIVLDSFDEIEQLASLASYRQQVMIRVTPAVDAHAHQSLATGVEDQKFGFSLASGAATEAVRRVLAHPNLELVGLHCHIGSQITRVASFEIAARKMVGLMAAIRDEHGIQLRQLDMGGGHAVPYLEGESDFDLTGYATRLRVALHDECGTRRLPVPDLTIEPGRATVAPAGVTLYRVVTVKRGSRVFVAVDGGMSDNARPALYGARYTVRMVGRVPSAPLHRVTVVGRHCEAGDVLAADVMLPEDIHAGDLLAVPCSGAYHYSLASNYNMVGRPPVVGVAGGASAVLVRRETEDDVLARDIG